MIAEGLEHNIILAGWVTAFVCGLLLLLKKTPGGSSFFYYKYGKNTWAIAMLLFGCEILFQWILHVYSIANPFLSVSVYLFAFCAASLLIAAGYCFMLRPELLNKRQIGIAVVTQAVFSMFLLISCSLPGTRWKVRGLLLCCVLLFLITCLGFYYCVIVYKSNIDNLRRYYSDELDNMTRWMPGVGFGVLAFLISAPFICWLPRWAGVYQVSLGVIMIVYTYVCVFNFCSDYTSVSVTFQDNGSAVGENADEDAAPSGGGEDSDMSAVQDDVPFKTPTMSDSLQDVMKNKELRWQENGGYRTPGITIEQAAREMGTNRSYLSKYLNEVRNLTFYEWVAQMRINEAQSLLLAERGLSIERISSMVGFSSPSTFSSSFKRMVGVSPNQWRILH